MKQIEQFNNWFNNKFGWFFTNGMKIQRNKFKEKEICCFLSKKTDIAPTITPLDFARYKDKKEKEEIFKKINEITKRKEDIKNSRIRK